MHDDFCLVLNCDKYFCINLVKFYISENVLHNGKDFSLQVKSIPMSSSFSTAFANIFLFYYETNFINHNINFFRYIDDDIVLNFDSISLSIYPNE